MTSKQRCRRHTWVRSVRWTQNFPKVYCAECGAVGQQSEDRRRTIKVRMPRTPLRALGREVPGWLA